MDSDRRQLRWQPRGKSSLSVSSKTAGLSMKHPDLCLQEVHTNHSSSGGGLTVDEEGAPMNNLIQGVNY